MRWHLWLKRVLLTTSGWFFLSISPVQSPAGVTGQIVRVEAPTTSLMEWQEIEVFSGQHNVVFKHPEMFSGTVIADHDIKKREGNGMTDGHKDTHLRGPDFRTPMDPVTRTSGVNPWFEINLGKPVEIDRIILYASRYGAGPDKGPRLLTILDADRKVAWAAKWKFEDRAHYPGGIFAFDVARADNPAVGVVVRPNVGNWVSMGWLLDATEFQSAPDAAARMKRFADRNSPANIAKLARVFFSLLADDVPELAGARQLHAAGKDSEALDEWKKYWFAKMRRVNTHQAYHSDFFTYATHGDDLVDGISVTISDNSATATRFTPGSILWINVPDPAKDVRAFFSALSDTEAKAQVGRVSRPLIEAYRRKPDPRYPARWSEMMDDWSLNFFEDAAQSPYEVENLFTFNPCNHWATMMEDLSDAAVEHPELIGQISAVTLARVQRICAEKYSTGWWRQARYTVFNHQTGGIVAWDNVFPYIDELHPARRAMLEWRQQYERWMTLGTEPDGSMTEIGDDGHMVMPLQLGYVLAKLEAMPVKPEWYTPGWRNRAMESYDNSFFYLLRHMAPGGYEHRFGVSYRPERWTSQTRPYAVGHPGSILQLDRGNVVFAVPEVRRMLDALGHLSAGRPIVADPLFKAPIIAKQAAHDDVAALLGNDKPGKPHINSDWMPYTGAYYFRGSWDDDAPFLAMMAPGSHGGSQPTQWPFTMFYFYDYNYPLLRSQPIQVDGLPPNPLFGRHTFEPGTKTNAITCAEEKPAADRWHCSSRFDFGEAVFHGAYQKLPSFKGGNNEMTQLPEEKAITDVQTTRQVLQLRRSRMFIITDLVRLPTGRESAHQLSIPYKILLSSRQKGTRPFSPAQLQVDEKNTTLRGENPDGPSLTFQQFAGFPIKYRIGREAKLDYSYYSQRLTSAVGIAEQEVFAEYKPAAESVLVSLIDSRNLGADERIASVEPLNRGATVSGFHARLRDGGEIYYQAAAAGAEPFICGPVEAQAQALLVELGGNPADGIIGIVLGCKNFSVHGKPVPALPPDCEFASASGSPQVVTATAIYAPIDPVSFKPDCNAFIDTQVVQLVSKTPNVEIRYTTDGTPPTRTSRLYTGPITISQTTDFAARAYRLGGDGKPLEADDFEINGTHFTLPTYAWFHKKPFHPAIEVSEKDLRPGLNYEYLQAPWYRLYASEHWMPADSNGVADREMDLSAVKTHDYYGMRYKGYIQIPQEGLYTFHAPHEFVWMDNAPSYDLRLYIDGEEWDLSQWWHAHGTWSVPLRKGPHVFEVDFADARTDPWRKSGIWRYYPRPWVIYQGKPTDILISGPGLDQVRIPKEWFRH